MLTKGILLLLGALLLGRPFVWAAQTMAFSAEPILWQCEAAGAGHSYRVVLDAAAAAYLLSIYGDAQYGHLIETVQVDREPGAGVAIAAAGQTREGHLIRIKALDGGLTFQVEDSRLGRTTGRCLRDTGFN